VARAPRAATGDGDGNIESPASTQVRASTALVAVKRTARSSSSAMVQFVKKIFLPRDRGFADETK